MTKRAIIGAGISGLSAAYVLSTDAPVTLFEAAGRLGGHAHTHRLTSADGGHRRVDSGFIVFNDNTYPNLRRLFAELDIESQPTAMSLSVRCDGCGLEYSGGQGASGLFAQPRRIVSPRHLRLLSQVPRFHREASRVLAADDDVGLTWGEFLRTRRFGADFISHFAVPFVSCVWSCTSTDADRYPAHHLFRFLDHHQMLGLGRAPGWRTVVGGSATYVDALADRLARVRRATPVTAIARHADGVDVTIADGEIETFDQVVVATHADDVLAILVDASDTERAALGAIGYSDNPTWLHRDASVLPTARRARAAWNFRLAGCDVADHDVLVSYWMNELQHLDGDDLIVTLNPQGWVDPDQVEARMTYRHPVFTREGLRAADELRRAGGSRLAFAGAYLGWGFHEDGCRSGIEAAARLGVAW